tara:strand:- start:676 stop:804 length:129 start_codon:yes stop_codon:yes gene_type:complete
MYKAGSDESNHMFPEAGFVGAESEIITGSPEALSAQTPLDEL